MCGRWIKVKRTYRYSTSHQREEADMIDRRGISLQGLGIAAIGGKLHPRSLQIEKRKPKGANLINETFSVNEKYTI